MRVLSIFGTRPEAIKMAPVVHQLEQNTDRIVSIVCVTAQHREMLDQVLQLFNIVPDYDLNLMREGQDLAALTGRVLESLNGVIRETVPDVVLVQGDTTTAMAGALSAFYQKVPVGHVEAGLRTGDRYRPFPEEINRRLISVLASRHFAPTNTAASALRAEGVPAEAITVTGNTAVDALHCVVAQTASTQSRCLLKGLRLESRRLVLVTAHRRENLDAPLRSICQALVQLVNRNPDVLVVYPAHLNPHVQDPVRLLLKGHEQIHVLTPLSYETFVRLMDKAYLILTDSGGIQEEAPAMGKPVLVMRRETERPEAVEAGTAKVVGTDTNVIVRETERLLHDQDEYKRMAKAVSPYGDGHAAERIVAALISSSGSKAPLCMSKGDIPNAGLDI